MTEQELTNIRQNPDQQNWPGISYYQTLSEEFIREFSDCVYWPNISYNQTLSEEFIREFSDRVYWPNISHYQTLSEKFIREFSDRVYWISISSNQTLSEEFIREFSDCVDWSYISHYQTLSEEFIREFSDRVYWISISSNQTLSEEFIREFSDCVYWPNISYNQTLTQSFIEEFNLTIPEDNWRYKSDQEKLEAIVKSGLYQIESDCVIAYKGIKKNWESSFKRGFKYALGQTVYSNADFNISNENSFGLSAWTLEKAKEYCNKKIIKVSIPVYALAALVHEGGKIRCTCLTVLEEI